MVRLDSAGSYSRQLIVAVQIAENDFRMAFLISKAVTKALKRNCEEFI